MSAQQGPIDLAPVRARLHELAAPVAAGMRSTRRRRAVVAALEATRWSWLALPGAYLATAAIAAAAGRDVHLSWYALLPLWLAGPAIVVLGRARAAGRAKVSDVGALAELDRELALADRLSAAREFVDATAPDGFMQAAIRDAERRIEQARGTMPGARDEAPRPRAVFLVPAVLGLAALWLAGLLVGSRPTAAAPPADPTRVVEAPTTPTTALAEPETVGPRPSAPTERDEPQTSDQHAGDETAGDDGNPAQQTRRGRNPQGAGRSAQARTSQGGGAERGMPSDQAQGTKGHDASKAGEKKPRQPKDGAEREHEARPRPQEQSGATQGRGSGRGSSRSPTATPWASKDQVVADEQDELEEDEEVDDENDESEARGGLQPNLRQRKPPVNRDLQISMGGGPPDDDANGRGGPGGPKKQRGVAQLVLGVTFPDHVTSPPSPGMSKVTQERIEPQAQQSDQVGGEDRGRREAPIGHLSHRVLSPWMQDLVREFYLSIRANSRTE